MFASTNSCLPELRAQYRLCTNPTILTQFAQITHISR